MGGGTRTSCEQALHLVEEELGRRGAHHEIGAACGEEAARVRSVFDGATGNEIWSLFMLAARLPEVLEQAAAAAEPSHLAKFTFQLAQAFNFFYNRRENRILEETDETRRAVLVFVADFVRRQLTHALDTLGIEVPDRM